MPEALPEPIVTATSNDVAMHGTAPSASPLVTVVTPSFNQGQFIAETIESILGQDYPKIEYLVMDGGSTDSTLDVLHRYDGRVRWQSGPDAGQSDAIHKGFQLASGEILAWLNADDVYTPGAISRAVAAMAAHPGAPFVYGRAAYMDRDGRPSGAQAHRAWDYDYLLNVANLVPQPAAFFRRTDYDAVGGVSADLHYVMDYDLWLKLAKRGDPAVIDSTLARVRMYAETKTSSGGLPRMAEMRRMIATHGRDSIPDWHRWDLVRAYVLAAQDAWTHGDRSRGVRMALRAVPPLAHPRPLRRMFEFIGRRLRRLGTRMARRPA